MADEQRLSKALGLFSLGLGAVQLVAPRRFAQSIGVQPTEARRTAAVRAVGAREVGAGVGLLARRRPAGWVWARVAGDAMDLALLGRAPNANGVRRDRVTAATAAVIGVTAVDLVTGVRMARNGKNGHHAEEQPLGNLKVSKAITVNRSPDEVYAYWRDFGNLPRFMDNVESVTTTGDGRSHWKVKAPLRGTVEWDAEIVEDRPGEMISWRSVENADVKNAGTVRFKPAPGGRGTEIHVELEYSPPGGPVGAAVAWLFGEEPSQQTREDLRRFKQVMETGEVVRSEATLDGSGPKQRAAQPAENAR